MGVLKQLSKDLDAFQLYLFAGLRRCERAVASGYVLTSAPRILVALAGVCTWLLACVVRSVGYAQLTAEMLWEWANSDPLWLAVLAKSTFTLGDLVQSVPDTPLTGAFFPSDLAQIQDSLAGAFLGLAGSNIAFPNSKESLALSEVTDPSIGFARHWSKLALAVADNDLIGPFLKLLEGPAQGRKVQFVSFLSQILQPPILYDPPWINNFPSAPFLVASARSASGTLRSQLAYHASKLWAVLATVPPSLSSVQAPMPRSFLRDCSAIAFHSPMDQAEVLDLIRGSLTGNNVVENAGTDPVPLASLLVLAANAGVGPGIGDDAGLSQSLATLQPEVKTLVAARLAEWIFSVAQTPRACWLAFLQGQAQPAFAAECDVFPATELSMENHQALGLMGLRKVWNTSPPELCCALDRQLLTDPVRSPYGHAFEYTVLAWALSQNPNACPVTGQPLAMESCQRDEELKAKATSWTWTTWLGW
jgi:hypothetical protein